LKDVDVVELATIRYWFCIGRLLP